MKWIAGHPWGLAALYRLHRGDTDVQVCCPWLELHKWEMVRWCCGKGWWPERRGSAWKKWQLQNFPRTWRVLCLSASSPSPPVTADCPALDPPTPGWSRSTYLTIQSRWRETKDNDDATSFQTRMSSVGITSVFVFFFILFSSLITNIAVNLSQIQIYLSQISNLQLQACLATFAEHLLKRRN